MLICENILTTESTNVNQILLVQVLLNGIQSFPQPEFCTIATHANVAM